METELKPVSTDDFSELQPSLEKMADDIMHYVATLSPSQFADILSVSNTLAIKALKFAYDFPNKSTGLPALNSFIGDAYRSLDASTLSQNAITASESKLRIISSAYGILKPDNIIKPYRLDFNKNVCGESLSPAKVFKQKVTVNLVKYIKDTGVKDIINLLPADAELCIDWKILRAFAKVHKVYFKSISNDGKLKTPIAKRLKQLRGLMCRDILEKGLDSFAALTTAESSHYVYSPGDSKPLMAVFIVAE